MGKILALTNYSSGNPSALPQTDEAYDEECVIINIFDILPHYKLNSKRGCFRNHIDQSESGTDGNERRTNNEPRSKGAREQVAIDCPNNVTYTRTNLKPNTTKSLRVAIDARTTEELEAVDSSAATAGFIQRWKKIVKP